MHIIFEKGTNQNIPDTCAEDTRLMQYSFSMEQNQPDIGLLRPEGRNDSIRLTCSTSSALLTGMVGTAGAGGSVTWLVALAAGLFTGLS